MTVKSPADIQGLEYDWLASDADGHVALFSTAGGGYAPEEFLRDTDLHDAAIEAILALRASTVARFAPTLAPGRRNTWRLMAERGLFGFDSDVDGGPYRLVAVPEQPVQLAELPGGAASVARTLAFPHLRFADTSVVPAADLMRACRR